MKKELIYSEDAAVCFAFCFGVTLLVRVTEHESDAVFSKELAIARPAKYS